MVERAFGAIEEELFAQMRGNTRQMRDPRLVTKSVNPFLRAVWTLSGLWGAIEEYLFLLRPERIHPALGMTPNQFEAMRLNDTGNRDHTLIRFDENIMLLTCPHAKRPFHSIDRRRGIWVGGMYFWHSAMAITPKKAKVEVRVEPWMANVIYAQIGNRWVAAIARNLRPYAGRTRREVEVALREEQRLARDMARKDSLSARQLNKKERLWAPETFDERLSKQQDEEAYLYQRLGMTVALPLPTGLWTRTNTLDNLQTHPLTETPPEQVEKEPIDTSITVVSDNAAIAVSTNDVETSESSESSLLEDIDGLF